MHKCNQSLLLVDVVSVCFSTPLGYTWQSDILPIEYYNSSEACSAILDTGITEIYVWGDSYMRVMII